MKHKYFGSVKFFKNLILVGVIVLIAVPTSIAFSYKNESKEWQSEAIRWEEQYKTFALLDADTPSYSALYPDFNSGTDASLATEAAENTVYLTFEDSPSAETEAILQALKQAGIKATFFVTKQDTQEAADRLKAIAAEGHTIGIHTSSHDLNTMYDSVETFLADLNECFTWVKETTGVTPTAFRMPGGTVNSYNFGLYRELIAEMLRRGFVPYDWNVSGRDQSGLSAQAADISQAVIEGVCKEGRSIVFLHDMTGGGGTAEAIPQIVENLQQKGYQFAEITNKVKPILFTYR